MQALSTDSELSEEGYRSQSSSICSMSDVESDDEAWPEAIVLYQPVVSLVTRNKEPAASVAPALVQVTSQALQTPSMTVPGLSGTSTLSPVQTVTKITPAQTPSPMSCAVTAKPVGSAQRAIPTSPAQTMNATLSPAQTMTPTLRPAQTVNPNLSPAETTVSGLQATGVTPAKKTDNSAVPQILNTPKQGLSKAPSEVRCHIMPN